MGYGSVNIGYPIPIDEIVAGLGGFEEIPAPLPVEQYKQNFLYFQVETDFEKGGE